MRLDLRSRAKRSVVGPICAIGWLALCLCFGPTSCLNPFPDDQPSEKDNERSPATADGFSPKPRGSSNSQPSPSAAGPMAPISTNPDDLEGAGLQGVPAGSEPDAGAPSRDAGPDAQPVLVQ